MDVLLLFPITIMKCCKLYKILICYWTMPTETRNYHLLIGSAPDSLAPCCQNVCYYAYSSVWLACLMLRVFSCCFSIETMSQFKYKNYLDNIILQHHENCYRFFIDGIKLQRHKNPCVQPPLTSVALLICSPTLTSPPRRMTVHWATWPQPPGCDAVIYSLCGFYLILNYLSIQHWGWI